MKKKKANLRVDASKVGSFTNDVQADSQRITCFPANFSEFLQMTGLP